MANIKGITIEIAGKTSGLVDSLKTADSALKKTNDALKAVDKALELDPKNVELLAEKEALLGNAVEETKDRLDALKEAAELAKKGLEDGTTTREQYAQLAAEVATTEHSLEELEDESRASGDAVKEAGDKAESAGVNWQALGAAAAGVVGAITAVTAAATEAATALVNMTVGGAEYADNILTMSTVTGVSTETLQEWSYAAELVDVSVDTMSGSMARVTRQIANAGEGSESAIANFENLGVAFQNADGSLRSSDEVFLDIVDALGEIDNETERDAVAMELLGNSARNLNPLIEAGSDTLRELGEQAHEAGYVLDDETLGAFGAFDDQLVMLQNGATAAQNALGTILLPLLTDLAGEGVDLLGQFSNAILDADGDVSQISAVISEMIPEIINIIMEYLPLFLELAGTLISSIAQGLIDNLDTILTSAAEILFTISDGILNALPQIIPVVINIVLTIVQKLIENLPKILEAGIDILLALVDGLTEAIPELIPTMVEAIVTITTALIDHLPELIEAGLELTGAIITGLLDALPDLIEGAFSIVDTLLETIGEAGPDLIDTALSWGADLISSFVSGITNALPNLVNGLTTIADTVASYLHFTSPDVGPLAHNLIGISGGHMIEAFAEGMEDELGTLEGALNTTGNTIAGGMTGTDYSGVLGNIAQGVAGLGSQGQVVNVYLGNELIDSRVISAQRSYDYVSGGY